MNNKIKTTMLSVLAVTLALTLGANTVYAESEQLTGDEINAKISETSLLKIIIDNDLANKDMIDYYQESLTQLNANGVFLPDQPQKDVEAWQQRDNTSIGGEGEQKVLRFEPSAVANECEDECEDNLHIKVKAAYQHVKNIWGINWTYHVQPDVWSAEVTTGGQADVYLEVEEAVVNFKPYLIVKKGVHTTHITATFTGVTTLQDSSLNNLNIADYQHTQDSVTKQFKWIWDQHTSAKGETQAQIAKGNYVLAEIRDITVATVE